MNNLQPLFENIKNHPVKWSAAARSLILMLTSFGLHWTPDQIASVMLFLEAILAIFTHNAVTPNVKVDGMIQSAVANDRAFNTPGL